MAATTPPYLFAASLARGNGRPLREGLEPLNVYEGGTVAAGMGRGPGGHSPCGCVWGVSVFFFFFLISRREGKAGGRVRIDWPLPSKCLVV